MSSPSQHDKAVLFRALHQQPGVLLMPNPWDAGSAQMLARQGFAALATSSGAAAAALGKRDGQLSRDEVLAHLRAVAGACEVPVAADLENCFADDPAGVAETIRLAAATGIVGGSVEDASGRAEAPLYEFAHATERVAAAAAAARALPFPFTLTARTENFLRGNPDLEDTIRRLKAFADAGADVVFAPGLPDLEAVRRVVNEVGKPVNFMVGIPGKSWSVAELTAAGVKRISFATSLYRVAMAAARDAAIEIREQGTFGYLARM